MQGVICHRAKSSGAFYREPRDFTLPYVAYPSAEAVVLETIVKMARLGDEDLLGRALDELQVIRRKP